MMLVMMILMMSVMFMMLVMMWMESSYRASETSTVKVIINTRLSILHIEI